MVPHEYFRVLPESQLPDAEVRRRTIGFCVEHPGTDTFDTTLRTVVGLGVCVDINDDSTAALSAAGIGVERFHLGYSDRWDRWHGADTDTDRGVDVLYLGTVDPRRSRLLSHGAEALADHEVFMAMPPHEPMVRPRPDFFMGDDKLRLLANSQLLLNVHRAASRSFEWVRALEAMCNGCVVVSEHSTDFAPLVAGRHLVAAAPHRLNFVARALLERPDVLHTIRHDAYRFLRDELPMRPSATTLVEIALQLGTGGRPAAAAPPPTPVAPWPTWSAGCTVGSTRADTITFVEVDGSPVAIPSVSGAVAATDADIVRINAAGDMFFPRALERLRSALTQDATLDAVYGFVIEPDDDFRSALPFEPERVLRTNHLALASLWRRSALLEVLAGMDTGVTTEHAFTVALWRAAAEQRRAVHLLARPVVRQTAAPGTAHV